MLMIEPTPRRDDIDARTLTRSHLRMTVDDAIQATRRALIEAESAGPDVPHNVTDGLHIALCRLEAARKPLTTTKGA